MVSNVVHIQDRILIYSIYSTCTQNVILLIQSDWSSCLVWKQNYTSLPIVCFDPQSIIAGVISPIQKRAGFLNMYDCPKY